MARPVIAAILAATVVAGPALASHPTTRTENKRYTQLAGDVDAFQCDTTDETWGGLGGVCFLLQGDELNVVDIRIADDTGFSVAGFYEFTDVVGLDRGGGLAGGSFCSRANNLAIPARAVALVVYIDGPLFGPLECLPTGPGLGLRGRVRVNYNLRP